MPTTTGSSLRQVRIDTQERNTMPPYLTTPLRSTRPQLTPEATDEVDSTNTDEDIDWLLAFLNADQLACYCLYQSARPRMVPHLDAS